MSKESLPRKIYQGRKIWFHLVFDIFNIVLF